MFYLKCGTAVTSEFFTAPVLLWYKTANQELHCTAKTKDKSLKMFIEEYNEFTTAVKENNVIEIIDGAVDTIWTLYGLIESVGFNRHTMKLNLDDKWVQKNLEGCKHILNYKEIVIACIEQIEKYGYDAVKCYNALVTSNFSKFVYTKEHAAATIAYYSGMCIDAEWVNNCIVVKSDATTSNNKYYFAGKILKNICTFKIPVF